MPVGISSELANIVRGADGTLLYIGAAVVGQTYVVTNSEASTTIKAGEAVRADLTNTVVGLPRDVTGETVASTQGAVVLKGLRASGSSDACWYGVAQDSFGITVSGLVAGAGSICGVQTTTAALTAGNKVGGAASGLVAVSAGTAGSSIVLGNVIKINTTGATGTGSTSWAGILVNPL